MNNKMTCDPERIELFLGQKLSEEEQTAFELHLDDCDDCRRRLEAAAAGDDVWSGVREALWGEQLPPDGLRPGDSSLDSATGGDTSFSHDTVLKLLAPTDDDRMIGRLGTYEVVGVIGSGGMGVVLKAFDAALNRYVAIKVLAPHLGSSGAARKRFSREAQAAAAVVHEAVIEIHGVADVDGLPYLVMPYVRGPSLQRRLDREGPLALVEILRIAVQAAAGLAAAHAQGLVHRDVKPANILLADGVERVKLTDFGLARAADDASLTKTGIIAGTPQYMSPEQARGESVDQRSDLFSLGSVLYAMCTGRAPFRAETSYGVLRRITDDEPRPIRQLNPDVPEWLCRIIARLMAKQPDDRFESAREVAELLEECLAHVQQPTAVPLPAPLVARSKVRRFFSGSRRKVGVIAMTAAFGISLLGMVLWQATAPPDIAGKWTGEQWGAVVLEAKQPGQYEGNYTDSDHARSGAVNLEWSRIERRFNGTWREGEDRNGRISIRLVGDQIRGAWTTGEDSQKESGTPRLADLLWTRSRDNKTQRAEAAAKALQAEAVAKAQSEKAKLAFAFLADVPEFRNLDLTVTEDGLKELVEEHHLELRVTRKEDEATTYTLHTPKGECVVVMFRHGKCSGIQRLRADPLWTKAADTRTHPVESHQSDPREPSDVHSTSKEKHTLRSVHYRGICVRSEDGRPIRGAVVRFFLYRQSTPHLTLWKMMTTDADGRFTIEGQIKHEDDIDLKRSRIAITASKRASRVFYWQDSPSIARLEMAPAASITGRVTDSESQPVAGAIVRVGSNPLPGVNEAMTDADGRFGIADLEAAEELSFGMSNVLVVAHPEHNPQTATFTSVPSSIDIVLKSNSSDLQQSVTPKTQPAEPQPKTATATPKRVRHFPALTTGNDVTIACSADGKRIAIANGNPTRIMQRGGTSRVKDNWKPSADILDAETGKTVVSLKLSTADEDAVLDATERISHFEVTALAFSPDGNVVAVGTSIGQVKLFDARTGELVRSLDDEQARLADEKTPENWKRLRRAMGSVASLAFSPDGRLLATCGGSFADFAQRFDSVSRTGFHSTGPGRLKVWDARTGTLKHDLVGHNDHAYAVAFSPDGNLLASAGRWLRDLDFGNGVILWDGHTGTQIRSFRTTANGGTRSIAFSPDSKLLAMGTLRFDNANDTRTGGVSLVDVSSGITQWLVTVPGWAKPLVFSPDERRIAVLCGGPSIRFLETETGRMRHEIRPDDSQDVRWANFAMASQGHVLAIGVVDNKRKADAQREGGVEVWSTRGSDLGGESRSTPKPKTTKPIPKPLAQFTTSTGVRAIACSADGELIAMANGSPGRRGGRVTDDWKPSVEILGGASLKLTTGDEDALLAATGRSHFEVEALALSADRQLVAVGTGVGQVKLFNARTGDLVRSLDDEREKLADKKTPEKLKALARAMGSVASLAFSPDGSLLATCGRSFDDSPLVQGGVERLREFSTGPGRLKVWEVKTGTLKHDLVGHSHAYAVSFSPDGSMLASAGRWLSGSREGTGVILWNSHTGEKVRTMTTRANGGTHSVAFSPDGKMMAIASQQFDKDKANDASTGLISLAYVASGITQWQRTFPGSAKPVAFAPDGKSVAVLCGGRSIRFLEVETGVMMHEIQSDDYPKGGRWHDFVIAPQGHILAIGGVDSERKGRVELWDFLWDVGGPPASSAPAKDADN